MFLRWIELHCFEMIQFWRTHRIATVDIQVTNETTKN